MTDLRLPSDTSSLRATKFSATRLPTSCGEVPAGHLLKYDCAASGVAVLRNMIAAKNGTCLFCSCKCSLLIDLLIILSPRSRAKRAVQLTRSADLEPSPSILFFLYSHWP